MPEVSLLILGYKMGNFFAIPVTWMEKVTEGGDLPIKRTCHFPLKITDAF